MTEIDEALADTRPEAAERRLQRLAAALYTAIQIHGHRQKDIIARTGLSRETIRRHVEDERIRRGEIPPTPRYLAEQQRRARPKKRSTING